MNIWRQKKFINRLSVQKRRRWLIAIFILLILLAAGTFYLLHRSLQLTVQAGSVNLCASPSPRSRIIRRVARGQRVTVLRRNQQTDWYYVRSASSKGWVAAWLLRDQSYDAAKSGRLAESTIVLDPGHGGIDSGTLAPDGAMEKHYTLPTALKTYRLLKAQHARVLMTRHSDKTVSLAARPAMSNRVKATLFISFHFNSAGQRNLAYGYEVFKYHHNADQLAASLDQGFHNLPLYDRGIAYGNFQVLRDNRRPAVLIEMGFMDSDFDFPYIKNPAYQQQVAVDIVASLNRYIK
ncbi:MAG: N-acetylmuramoyl-L-alanine amidase [Oenococcus sp.]|uniref:N-acetylmuramoyl-L-alanine amidase n=1 Tax=Oenococcus TaxID=46254 RepID=UPI0021E82892|nr:N-acetylmuramoyl-L-alanine amidase [Oenococcus kitaharae]MCV3295636.1 N-acetylmuramoyl-L-alanine amidase [Oenococcus kitaharae]